MTDDRWWRHRRRRRRRPTTAKICPALILPKILNFRKIASFWKTAKIGFFSQVRPCDERGKWRTTDDEDRRRRRPTTTTTDDDNNRRRTTATTDDWGKNLVTLILPKILNFRKIASFWKTAKIWFFSQVRPCDERGKWRTIDDDGEKISSTHFDDFRKNCDDSDDRQTTDDEQGNRRTNDGDDDDDDRRRRKNLVHSFYQKSWILERLRVFEKRRKFDFFHRSVPVTKEGNDGRRRRQGRSTTATTEKISTTLILLKILDFRLRVFEKQRKFDNRSLPTKKGNDGRRRRRRRRRKNLVHSFYQKSWILEKLRVFQKRGKFDFFHRSVPVDERGKWRTIDDEGRRRRKNLVHSFY